MTAEPGIRDAVRQLGRAVGTLVRAVVGSVGRRTPVTAERPESGPPQEWLDLVAETDPDWLARSAWADRGRRAGQSSRVTRDPDRIDPEWDSDDESSARPVTDAEEGTGSADPARSGRKLTPRQARGTTGQAVRTTGHSVSAQGRPSGRAGDSVAGAPQGTDSSPESVEGSMSSPRTSRHRDEVHPAHGRPSTRAGDSVAGAPQGADPTPEPAEGSLSSPRTPRRREVHPRQGRRSRRASDPVAGAPQGTDPFLEPVGSYAEPGRSRGGLRPVPDLESYEPVPAPPERSRRAGVHLVSPDLPAARPGLTDFEAPDRPERGSPWPELPRTQTLDDPTPGLAAQLWLADGPDTLTTAQRRS